MKKIFNLAVIFIATTNVLAYHDPDFNYHLNQLQNLQNCGGYSYHVPAVQLTTAGVKTVTANNVVPQSLVPSYHYVNTANYGQHFAYQTPKVTYASQQSPFIAPVNYAGASQSVYSGQREYHGYATTAGLSASSGRTVKPLATYAQAPIIAKITAAPLIAKFALAPSKASYARANVISHEGFTASGSLAKASLSSQSTMQSGGQVVSQVYAAPSTGYSASPALKLQQPASTYNSIQPVVAQYARSNVIPVINSNYATPTVTQYSAAGQITSGGSYYSYNKPITSPYSTPVGIEYTSPNLQYNAPAVFGPSTPVVNQYSAPNVVQYSTGSSSFAQYNGARSAGVSAVSNPAVVAAAAPYAAHVYASTNKNVHTDFLQNYDAHPRYAYEYGVNDPRTGDIHHQKEERDGEVVKGQYSLVEPDGSVRTVDYVADWKTGFHANVRNSKDNQH